MFNRHHFQQSRKDKKNKSVKRCVVCGDIANKDIPGTPFCLWCWDREHH